MNRYQSHKVVEAGRITAFVPRDGNDQGFDVTVEGGEKVALVQHTGDRILRMATETGQLVNGGWLMLYEDGYISWSPHEQFADGYDVVQPSSGKSKIVGYRELDEGEVAAMNDVKGVGAMLGDFCEIQRADEQCDQRWVSLGITHFQQGLMCLTRAIAKPDFF